MSPPLNALTYFLLTAILSTSSILSIKNNQQSDEQFINLNRQAIFSSYRHLGESAVVKIKGNLPPLTSLGKRASLSEFYEISLLKHRQRPFLGTLGEDNTALWITYEEARSRARNIYSGLINTTSLISLQENSSSFLGIYASNSVDCYLVELACHWGGLVTIPINPLCSISHLVHVIRKTCLEVLVVEETFIEQILGNIKDLPSLKHIIVIASTDIDYECDVKATVKSLRDIERSGSLSKLERPSSKNTVPESIASIYFSSKSKLDEEGEPLGVVLTHQNILSSLVNHISHLPHPHQFKQTDTLLHNYSIDNVFQYILQLALCYSGGSITFFEAGTEYQEKENSLNMLKQFSPSIYGGDSKFLTEMKELIDRDHDSTLYQWGLENKQIHPNEERLISNGIYNVLLFNNIKNKTFGRNIRLLFIDDDTQLQVNLAAFYSSILGVPVIRLFNRPETTSSMTITSVHNQNLDNKVIGSPFPGLELKLVDKGNYTAEDKPNPRGEITVRGNTVFEGYWDSEDCSYDAIDPDGWFTTGSIGELLPNGCIVLLSQ